MKDPTAPLQSEEDIGSTNMMCTSGLHTCLDVYCNVVVTPLTVIIIRIESCNIARLLLIIVFELLIAEILQEK